MGNQSFPLLTEKTLKNAYKKSDIQVRHKILNKAVMQNYWLISFSSQVNYITADENLLLITKHKKEQKSSGF